jgi:hypothetical protein
MIGEASFGSLRRLANCNPHDNSFCEKFSIKLVNAYVKFTANVCFTVFHSVMAAKDEFLYLLCKWVVYLNLFLQFVIPTTHI